MLIEELEVIPTFIEHFWKKFILKDLILEIVKSGLITNPIKILNYLFTKDQNNEKFKIHCMKCNSVSLYNPKWKDSNVCLISTLNLYNFFRKLF